MVTLSFSYARSMEMLVEHNAQELKPIVDHAKLIVRQKASEVPPFIAITGCSAVGKSFLARELAELLKREGIRPAILKGDDFFNPDHFDPDHFHPRLEHLLMHSVIQSIKRGDKVVKKPMWNPEELRPPSKVEEHFSVDGVDIVLFEGEFGLCSDAPYDFSKYSQFGVFIDAKDEDLLEWKWQRKRSIEEKTKEEFVQNNISYLQSYRAYVQSARNTTLYLLLKDAEHRYTLQKNPTQIQNNS